jgi:hypothetical protein
MTLLLCTATAYSKHVTAAKLVIAVATNDQVRAHAATPTAY